MAFDQHTNFAFSTVQSGSGVIGSTTGTTINIVNTADLPDPGSGAYNVTVWPSGVNPTRANAEIMRVTAKSPTTLTVTRAQETTTALSVIAAGYQVALAMTAKLLTDIEAAAGTGGGGGSSVVYANLQYQQPSGTDGGTAVTNTWTTYPLNTKVNDPSSIISTFASHQFTLPAGTYLFSGNTTFYIENRSQLRIQNITDAATVALGVNQFVVSSENNTTTNTVDGMITISGSKTFEMQYRVQTARGGSNDIGISAGWGTEVYGNLNITKIA